VKKFLNAIRNKASHFSKAVPILRRITYDCTNEEQNTNFFVGVIKAVTKYIRGGQQREEN
jgi:hypothetical protein